MPRGGGRPAASGEAREDADHCDLGRGWVQHILQSGEHRLQVGRERALEGRRRDKGAQTPSSAAGGRGQRLGSLRQVPAGARGQRKERGQSLPGLGIHRTRREGRGGEGPQSLGDYFAGTKNHKYHTSFKMQCGSHSHSKFSSKLRWMCLGFPWYPGDMRPHAWTSPSLKQFVPKGRAALRSPRDTCEAHLFSFNFLLPFIFLLPIYNLNKRFYRCCGFVFKALPSVFAAFLHRIRYFEGNPRKILLGRKPGGCALAAQAEGGRRSQSFAILIGTNCLLVQDEVQYFAKPMLISNKVFPKKDRCAPSTWPLPFLFGKVLRNRFYQCPIKQEWGQRPSLHFPV